MTRNHSRLTIRLLGLVAGLGLLLAACGDDSGSDSSDDDGGESAGATGECPTDVCMEGIAYNVEDVGVSTGATVSWTNLDGVAHTVTAGTPDAPQREEFDSGNIEEGASFDLPFDTAGEFPYFCTIHPSMVGTVIVE